METSLQAPPFKHSVGITGMLCPNGCGMELIIYRLGMPEWYYCPLCNLRVSTDELAAR